MPPVKKSARSVLVTGGTGALGAATIRRFLEDGHSVTSPSRAAPSVNGLATTFHHFGDRFHALQGDVTDADSVEALVHDVVARLGTIEVLVHLVGGWAGGHPLQDHSPATWDRAIDLNLRSAFLCARAVLPLMRQQAWGRIVLISSQAARSHRRGQGAYAIAKAGVSVLAEAIAEENNDRDVTANVIAPSFLDTPTNRASLPAAEHGSLVSVEDVAEMISFLSSEEAGQLRGAWLPAFGRR
jgi:NAD(P)-dependent dehydrogenase (short-subunit alcohol dehydrogenase family)